MIASQPLDSLMTQLGVTNADLVKASTEQLTFKMVNKGRSGRHVTPNVQEKILAALLKVRPDLKLRRRDLFLYEPAPSLVENVTHALSQIREKKIKYPQFIDLLVEGGVTAYKAEVGANRITFYGIGGQAHIEQGPVISEEDQKIQEAGISFYEVNTRHRKIEYKGVDHSYKENIPPSGGSEEPVIPQKPSVAKPKKAKSKKNKSMTTKARVAFRKRQLKRRRR
ncbi:MAG: hypothetical protein HY592_05825 [Candidatus Omnitrophica bacterium]|nr:hypothetical protein [Candidatus Omnitrophota bacterium]